MRHAHAAKHAAGIPAYDGWYAWKVERPDGMTFLHDLRRDLVAKVQQDASQRRLTSPGRTRQVGLCRHDQHLLSAEITSALATARAALSEV